MMLYECTMGTIVRDVREDRVGMIVGITNNRPSSSPSERKGINYAIPLVEWSDGHRSGIHPSNIEKLQGI